MTEIVVLSKYELSELLRQNARMIVMELREEIKSKPFREVMTKKELAEYLRCDSQKINRYMKLGLPYEQFGDHPRFRKSSIDEWLKSNKKPSEAK